MKGYILIHPNDNVIIALKSFDKGDVISLDEDIVLQDAIMRGHKIAIKALAVGDAVCKYGYPIGTASEAIEPGQHVHVHNVKTALDDVEEYDYKLAEVEVMTKLAKKPINAYKRANGDIGIRNELWIVPTVGCVNGIANELKKEFELSTAPGNFDGVHVFGHPYGCSQMGDDHVNTKETLQNIVKHPNAGAVLVLGLGCENNQIDAFKETLGAYDGDRVKFLVTQEVEDELEVGLELLEELYEVMKKDQREEMDFSKLRIGLECGGSDGLSGITANPLLGLFSDYIIHHGGTTVLTEVPEMFGGEQILMNRCKTPELFDKTVSMVNGFKQYYKDHGQVIYENPSPGNKKGGITTLEDKSLGCIRKSGDSLVSDVLKHNERISKKGLNLLSAPGNDLIATTALGASGCQLVLFTTGRGTPFGGFIPTMKISTNSALFEKKHRWMDFDAGQLVTGRSMDDLLEAFVDEVISVVNGKYVKNEVNDCREIAIFKSGVTL